MPEPKNERLSTVHTRLSQDAIGKLLNLWNESGQDPLDLTFEDAVYSEDSNESTENAGGVEGSHSSSGLMAAFQNHSRDQMIDAFGGVGTVISDFEPYNPVANSTRSFAVNSLPKLLYATANERVLEVEQLLKDQADPHQTDMNGWTALHWAAHCGHANIIDLLVDAGADPDALNNDGLSPLHLAVSHNHIRAAETLLGHGAELIALARTLAQTDQMHEAIVSEVGLCRIIDNCVVRMVNDADIIDEPLLDEDVPSE